ncbi:MAG: hypothetical protein IKD20_01865 [Clostridia bacterium]|nr:hypothetical protein [Clostridia bacterium]
MIDGKYDDIIYVVAADRQIKERRKLMKTRLETKDITNIILTLMRDEMMAIIDEKEDVLYVNLYNGQKFEVRITQL